jgi:hypothetical protein
MRGELDNNFKAIKAFDVLRGTGCQGKYLDVRKRMY